MVSARPLFALLCVLAAPLAVVTALHVRFCAIFCVRCVCVLRRRLRGDYGVHLHNTMRLQQW